MERKVEKLDRITYVLTRAEVLAAITRYVTEHRFTENLLESSKCGVVAPDAILKFSIDGSLQVINLYD